MIEYGEIHALKLVKNFNSNQISIIFIDDVRYFNSVFCTFIYNEPSKIVIISSTLDSYDTLQAFADEGFVNTIFVNPKTFKESNKFYIYELFPNFEVKAISFDKSTIVFPAKVNNILLRPIKVALFLAFPSSYLAFDRKSNKVYIGFLLKLLQTFVEFINGTFDIAMIVGEVKSDPYLLLDQRTVDFVTMHIVNIDENPLRNIILRQGYSNTILTYHTMVMVPVPNPLARQFYPFKPYTPEVWLLTVALLVFSTIFLTVVRRPANYLETTHTFWYYFGIIQRALFAQPTFFSERTGYKKIFYLLIFCGFILTTWYNALLGSYLTTTLSESPIRSIDDIARKNIKILVWEHAIKIYEKLAGFPKYMPHVSLVRGDVLTNYKLKLDKSFAYIEKSTAWDFRVQQMMFYKDIRFEDLGENLGNNAQAVNIKYNSFYKERLNRFIDLIKDVGLQKHWLDHAILDYIKYKPIDITLESSETFPIQPIEVNYFLIAFGILGAGWICALVALFGEIIVRRNEVRRQFGGIAQRL